MKKVSYLCLGVLLALFGCSKDDVAANKSYSLYKRVYFLAYQDGKLLSYEPYSRDMVCRVKNDSVIETTITRMRAIMEKGYDTPRDYGRKLKLNTETIDAALPSVKYTALFKGDSLIIRYSIINTQSYGVTAFRPINTLSD